MKLTELAEYTEEVVKENYYKMLDEFPIIETVSKAEAMKAFKWQVRFYNQIRKDYPLLSGITLGRILTNPETENPINAFIYRSPLFKIFHCRPCDNDIFMIYLKNGYEKLTLDNSIPIPEATDIESFIQNKVIESMDSIKDGFGVLVPLEYELYCPKCMEWIKINRSLEQHSNFIKHLDDLDEWKEEFEKKYNERINSIKKD